MRRLVEVFCATQRHQKTKNKKNETQTKVRMALRRFDVRDRHMFHLQNSPVESAAERNNPVKIRLTKSALTIK